jgi:uncharacterized membrane protein YeaQ/YmgE (transglycosylase-associated protein family)
MIEVTSGVPGRLDSWPGRRKGTHMGWVFVIVMGVIIGLLGKFVAPGDRDNVPMWVTVLAGIVGVLLGYGWLGGTKGIDWLAFFVSIIFAAILVAAAATVMGRVKKS